MYTHCVYIYICIHTVYIYIYIISHIYMFVHIFVTRLIPRLVSLVQAVMIWNSCQEVILGVWLRVTLTWNKDREWFLLQKAKVSSFSFTKNVSDTLIKLLKPTHIERSNVLKRSLALGRPWRPMGERPHWNECEQLVRCSKLTPCHPSYPCCSESAGLVGEGLVSCAEQYVVPDCHMFFFWSSSCAKRD